MWMRDSDEVIHASQDREEKGENEWALPHTSARVSYFHDLYGHENGLYTQVTPWRRASKTSAEAPASATLPRGLLSSRRSPLLSFPICLYSGIAFQDTMKSTKTFWCYFSNAFTRVLVPPRSIHVRKRAVYSGIFLVVRAFRLQSHECSEALAQSTSREERGLPSCDGGPLFIKNQK